MPDDHVLDEVAAWIRGAERVVALTGAGISTDSGIPDFRGPQGVWTKNPAAEKQATLQHYMGSRDVRVAAWKNRVSSPMWDAAPGPGHLALAEIERRGGLTTLVTQNVDGLHHKAGSNPNTIVEVHGNVREVMCMTCGDRNPMDTALERVRAGEDDPACVRCGGILKSATISFGQMLDPDVIARAEQAARRAEVFLAIGTSLTVTPVAYLPEHALANGAKLVIVNAQPTPFDRHANALFHDEIRDVLPALAERI